MNTIKEIISLAGLTNEDLATTATDIFLTGDIIHDFNNPQGMPQGQQM